MTIKEIRSHIENIIDPARGKTLKELNAIKHIGINDEKDIVILLVEVVKKGTEASDILKRELAKAIKIDLGFSGIKIEFEESKEASLIAGKDTKFILICGSKGGVGKSTVTINLAYALKNIGKKVGIIDADVYGASIAKMLFMEDKSPAVDTINKIIPYDKDGIQVISTDFFSQKESPLLWRGNMLSTMVNNFLYQVSWAKDLDVILIDCPSGTGDVMMDLGTLLPSAIALVVTEEDMISSLNTLKTIKGLYELKQKVMGIVINKYTGNDYASMYLGSKASELEVLATIPYYNNKDNIYLVSKDSKAYGSYEDLANLVSIQE